MDSPTVPGMSGVTALHEAAASGRLDVVELLLKNGADITAVDGGDNTIHPC